MAKQLYQKPTMAWKWNREFKDSKYHKFKNKLGMQLQQEIRLAPQLRSMYQIRLTLVLNPKLSLM
jgi:hypothetical protein